MAITSLTVSRVEAYKNLKTPEDRIVFSKITEELKRLARLPIEQKRSYLTDENSYIYQYRLVSAQLVKMATEITDEAFSIVTSLADKGDTTLNQSYNMKVGYYTTRRDRIIRKMISVLMLLPKNIARYNEQTYYQFFGPMSEYDYQNITYIPKEELVNICGEHSNTDYQTVLDALRITGVIKTPINKWFFTPDEVDENGNRIYKRGGYAKPIWVDSDALEMLNKCHDDKMTYISAEDSYKQKIEQLKDSSDEVLGAIATILCIIPSNSLYISARERLRKPAKVVRVKDGYDYTEDERRNGKLVKYEVIDSMRIKVVDCLKQVRHLDFAYTGSLSVKNMAESNIYELLRFTQDDYSGRLHTVLTRIKREFKEHLIFINGSRIADVDIRACQPTILCAVLAQKGFPELKDLVKDQDFYAVFDALMKDANILDDSNTTFYLNDEDRDKVKQNCMEVLFSNGARFNKFVNRVGALIDSKVSEEKGRQFRELMFMMGDGSHPYNKADNMSIPDRVTYEFSSGKLVRKPVSTLPKRMQSMEVDIMFGEYGVLQTLENASIHLATTIHDAVLVEELYGNITKRLLEGIFNSNLNKGGQDHSMVTAKTDILVAKSDEGAELSLEW